MNLYLVFCLVLLVTLTQAEGPKKMGGREYELELEKCLQKCKSSESTERCTRRCQEIKCYLYCDHIFDWDEWLSCLIDDCDSDAIELREDVSSQ